MARAKWRVSPQQQSVIRKVRNLHEAGELLSITAAKRSHPRRIQRAYAVKPPWGWKRALAIGVGPR